MDIKLTSYVEFEVVKTDANGVSRIYRFNMPWGAPYPEAFNCLSEMEAQLAKKQQELDAESAQPAELEAIDSSAAENVADAPASE